MDIPDFCGWVKFDEYKTLEGKNFPGIYLLSHFKRKPNSLPNVTSKNIVYIGETTGQTISKRLYQFKQSAFLRKNGHSGGWTYSGEFLNRKKCEGAPNNLFVSILPVDRPEKESKAYIKLIERLLIWNFFQKNKDYPICNTV